MMEEMEPTSRFHSEMEELLRPRIKPKAPASLKQNVLQAIEHDPPAQSRPQHAARRISAWWAAAAVLLIGVLTFALWPQEKEPLIQPQANGRQVAIQHPHPQESKAQSDSPLSPKRVAKVGREKSGSTTPDPLVASSSQSIQEEETTNLQPVLESEETSVVGDLKIEKVDDDTVVVTSQSTGDQAAVTLDDDEMEVKELDQKEMSYYDDYDEEPALYSVILDEDEFNLAQYLFGEPEEIDDEEGFEGGEEIEDEDDAYYDDGMESYEPQYIVGIDADNHQVVDAPVYNDEQAQELAQHLTEIGVDGVSVFDSPGEARDYADQLMESVGVPVGEEAALDEPVE